MSKELDYIKSLDWSKYQFWPKRYLCAVLSCAAYIPPTEIKGNIGLFSYACVTDKTRWVYVFSDPLQNFNPIVAFPGTRVDDGFKYLLDDLKSDIDILTMPNMSTVHRGFFEAWESLSRNLYGIVPKGRLTITGHSLGGALATIASKYLNPLDLYTYGCPKVGDREFLSTISVWHQYRYRLGDDVIPLLPPGNRLTHVTKETHLSDYGLWDNIKSGFKKFISSRLDFPERWLKDHEIVDYCKDLE